MGLSAAGKGSVLLPADLGQEAGSVGLEGWTHREGFGQPSASVGAPPRLPSSEALRSCTCGGLDRTCQTCLQASLLLSVFLGALVTEFISRRK